jgi:Spy/CpxP family protein refolding chaperone
MKRITFILTAFFAIAMLSPLWAQQKTGMQGMQKMKSKKMMGQMGDSSCPMMGTGHMQGFFLNQAESLGLSDSQVEQLKKIKQETQKTVIEKEAAYKIAKLELKELMHNPKAKRSDVEAKAKKVEELRSNIRLTELGAKLDARAVLTPEQLEKAKSMKMKGMRGGMMKMGDMSGKNGRCPMMGSNSEGKNSSEGKDGAASEHEKHHPNEQQ